MKKILFLAFLFIIPCFLFGQTAKQIDEWCSGGWISYSQAAEFVLAASEQSGLDGESAFDYAVRIKAAPKDSSPDDPITLGRVSLLIMHTLDIEGSLPYKVFRNARYAYRDMVFKRFIRGRSDPSHYVTGEVLLDVLNRSLNPEDNL